MSDKYILKNGVPVPCYDLLTWAKWFDKAGNRSLASTRVADSLVSTVFLGINHRFHGDGPPILYETMVFSGKLEGYQMRYTTRQQALAGHKAAVKKVKATL